MVTSSIRDRLTEAFAARGCRISFVGVERLAELKDTLADLTGRGELDPGFARRSLGHFQFEPPEDFPKAVSLVVIATPQKPTRLVFARAGGAPPLETVIPPTYLDRPVQASCREALSQVLTPAGVAFRRASVPCKALAVRSGLGKYGRNNVVYVEGCGSFVRLDAFYLDALVPAGHWGEPAALSSCESCQACRKACPTGAISAERFLVRAERCLTYFNEDPGEFPAWLAPTAHHAIVGCLRCQITCPMNQPFLDRVEATVEFSPAETALLEAGTPWDALPEALQAKLSALCLEDYHPLLARNLLALSARRASPGG